MRRALLVLLLAVIPLSAGFAGGVATPPTFAIHRAPGDLATNAGEPSLGLNPATGAAFFQSYATTYKVTFDAAGAATWRDVTPALGLGLNIDPILTTDPQTGVTIAGGLEGECSSLWSTADDGASWTPLGNACASPAFDHETIFTGPAHPPLPGRMTYYCAQANVEQCAASPNGGLTFGPAVPIDTNLHICMGMVGHGRVAPDGTAYVPAAHCQLGAGVLASTTNGVTWTTNLIPNSLPPKAGFDPSLAVTPSGWIYAAFQAANNHQKVALSKDGAAHWTAPRDVTPPGVATTTFSAMVAGDDERAAVAFLGTTTSGDAFAAGFAGTWDLYVAFTYDSGSTWTVSQATTQPIQRGDICTAGLSCSGGRNLLDFIDATVDAQGRVLVGYVDGCDGCTTIAGSNHEKGTIARQISGLTLCSAFD
jgi:hypothetical protein